MIKSISFIVLTLFFHFNELKVLRQPGYFIFYVKPTIFFYSVVVYLKYDKNVNKEAFVTNLLIVLAKLHIHKCKFPN